MLVLLLLLLTTAHAEEAPVRVRNRVSAGVLLNAGAGGAQVEAVVSDRLRMRWRTGPVAGELRFDGRLGVGFSGAGVGLRRTRIPTLAVHLRHERFWLEVGRFRVTGGDWRLADGVQGMAQLGRGVEVGGWLGAVPDPWTTAPAPRFGGGPAVRWTHEVAQVGATVELAGTAAGLDRAALVLDVRVELGTKLEIAGRADLQHGGPSKPILPADLGVVATLDPRDDLRVRVRYDAWTGLAFLQGWDRDPGIGRFAQRFGGVVPEFSAPQDGPDLTMAHQVAASARWTPAVGDRRLRIAPDVRYRHHVAPERRHARVRLVAGLEGLAKGRVDVGIDGGPTLWRGLWRREHLTRPKAANLERLQQQVDDGRIALVAPSTVGSIHADRVVLETPDGEQVLPNDSVYVFAGGVMPTAFLADAGIRLERHFGKRIEQLSTEEALGKAG